MATKATFSFTLARLRVLRVLDSGAVDADVLLALDLQGGVVASNVDGVAASPRCLAADRAIATHERVGMAAFDAEAYRPTVTEAELKLGRLNVAGYMVGVLLNSSFLSLTKLRLEVSL